MKAMFLVTWRQWLRGGARTWFVAFSALVCSTMLAAVQFGGFSLADSFKMESGFSQVVLAASQLVVALLVVYCVFHRWDYNALLGGAEMAVSLGINVRGLTLVSMLLCCLTSSVIVSQIGLISFIGLVAPHAVRLVVGNNHVYLIPGSLLAGASLLLLGDLFARTAIAPVILPIGAITSFLGGPLFLYLLFRGGRQA